MRKIKFRGISKKTGEFVFGDLVINGSTETYRIFSDFALCVDNVEYRGVDLIGCSGSAEIVLKETIGQLTGLKDKNGKEIFEGDIVASSMGDRIVEWGVKQTAFGWLMPLVKEDWAYGYNPVSLSCDGNELEVISSIHENTELLKEITK